MHLARLSLTDFRSYADVQVELEPGVCTFVGPNGQGKTNLVEAVGYLATAASHRVATDAPLVRDGATSAVLRAEVVRAGRSLLLELELNPGRSNRARVNRAPLPRARELLGLLRTVLFAPEDLALVKGEPDQRRRFLDELLVVRTPRLAGVRADYERVVRQRNALLKSAAAARRSGDLSTLDVWDSHLAERGAELVAARLELVAGLAPLVAASYGCLAPGAAASVAYRSALPDDVLRSADRQELASALAEALAEVRPKELERGVSLVGPHRDDLALGLGDLPAKGYASHGESWSFALALRLASFDLLAADGDDPVLVLDDVFAELDERRRSHLAERVLAAEQVLVTAAVAGDVPGVLDGVRYDVRSGEVRRA